MENMERILGMPWLVWVLTAVAMVVIVLTTEYLKPLIDKLSAKRIKRGRCGIKIPGLILFWTIGVVMFALLALIGWMKFGPVPVIVYIVAGGALNVGYYNDFLKLRTVVRKLVLGEVPIPDANGN